MAEKSEKGYRKTVQELVEDGDELPDVYIWRDSNSDYCYGPVDPNLALTAEIPVIDVTQLDSSSELLKLRSAVTSWGCFQAVNHGIENSFLDEVRQLAKEFFHLPMAEKQNYARAGDDYEGYGNDLVLFDNQPLDWTDRLYLLVSPEDRQKLQYWPENPDSLSNVLRDYTARLRRIEEKLLKSLARSLSLPDNCFLNQFGERRMTYARFNYYPPCSRPDLVLGLKPHADGSGITILLQDKEVKGLQILKDDKWFWVPIMPHALFFNVGDQLEIISNGIFKSPVHRAVTNFERERNTLAMFCAPDPEKEIGPLEELVDDERPRLFKKVRDYPGTYFHYYQQGKRPINAVRI
ncbi:protein srg1 [Phtheirospermum japonicum]|uniref:Protein srg1 n=1 Tax=Phtheirospermum japonicum TaxID=374723 RepID=A0A830CPL6_9LAMI|nr:protein srg1 [Phtheirospermum japonicum]